MLPFDETFSVLFTACKCVFRALVNTKPTEKAVADIDFREPAFFVAARGNRGFNDPYCIVRAGTGANTTAYAFTFIKE